MMIVHEIILLLLVVAVPINSLQCYECSCDQATGPLCDCGSTTEYYDQDYCVIIEDRNAYTTSVGLSRIPRNATLLYIKDPYFILAIESIRYNETTTDWDLWTSGIIYGCDWDLCNDPSLIDGLPDSFKLSINETWLNTNIYGTGQVPRCHNCTSAECGDTENLLNGTRCPLDDCLNATSCLAYNSWTDLDTGEQCYYAQCAPEYLDDDEDGYYGGKYKVDIEAIIYLAQNRSSYEIWEIDVYCAVDNCTRSTIFEEVAEQLSANISDLSAFPLVRPTTIPTTSTTVTITTTPLSSPLTCYKCECLDASTCPCTTTTVVSSDDFYCGIVRESFGQTINVSSGTYSYYDSERFIYEFPYVLVEESIIYDERGGRWETRTNLVIYGCNWNLCNKPELVPLLPNSYQMRLPEAWLNTSILGTGQPARDCHQCPNQTYCGTTDYLDASVCPIESCNTTCFVSDTYDNPAQDYLCYSSYCLPSETKERYRLEIEGVVFASQPNAVEIWKVDIYCRADNCSSPRIFRELNEQLIIQVGDLAAVFNETYDPTIPQLRCYDCYCFSTPNCSCERTTIKAADSTYCLISRVNFGQEFSVDLGHVDRATPRINVREFPYLLVEESISYTEVTGLWNTRTNYVLYGCNWDYCNHPSLVPYLPASFQMRLPEAWLNSSILGTGQPVGFCHECPDQTYCGTIDFVDISRCPVQSCNTTCLVIDLFDDPSSGRQCYQSFCAPPDSDYFEIDRHRVEIEGILYLPQQPRSVELWEVDIYCRANDCSRLGIFDEIKDQLSVAYGDLSVFDRIISTTGAGSITPGPGSTTPGPGSTTPGSGSTTPGPGLTTTEPATGSAIVVNSFNSFILLLTCLLPLNLY